jgi:putative transposase
MCRVLGVSRSCFYGWRIRQDRPPGLRRCRQEQVDVAVAASCAESHGIYGARKVVAELRRVGEVRPCRVTVARSMRRQGLESRVIRRRRPRITLADPNATAAPNLLDRDFVAEAPNRKWAADITYVPTDQGWAYLAVILDLFSRRIVGWAMADHLREELVEAALHDAVKQRTVEDGLLHHSDRGSQYTAADYRRMTCELLKMTPSMSRTGDCYDNAVVESFNGAYKREWMRHATYPDLAAARLDFMRYVRFYNGRRLHQTLGYQTPDEHEAAFTERHRHPRPSPSSQPVASPRGEAVT